VHGAVSTLVLAFAGALCVSLLLTYLVRGFALYRGLVDVPDGQRRCHKGPIPRVGGIAVFGSLAVAWWVVSWLAPEVQGERPEMLRVLLLGATAIFAVGLWDDIRGLSPGTKLAAEVAIALLLFLGGVRIYGLEMLDTGYESLPLVVSMVLTTLWLVGITNAFNLIDGSDGVAGGAALFACGSLFVVSLLNGDLLAMGITLTLAGAVLGFLFFNFPPASIFLGDSGSLFIGFMLAGLGLITTQPANTALAVLIPVIALGVPILDTLLAMVRRFLRRQPIFRADRGHIHHRLRDLGHSPRKVVFLLYAACAGFALTSLVLVQPMTLATSTLLLLVVGAGVWISVKRLRIPELEEVRRIVHRGLKQRSVIAHNVRVREAIQLLRQSEEPGSVLQALELAFETGEFERVEVWLASGVAEPFGQNPRIDRLDVGFCWRWSSGNGSEASAQWELQLPQYDEGDGAISRISLWCSGARPHLLTDIRLVALELQPELHQALRRLSNGERLVRQNVPAPPPVTEPAMTLGRSSSLVDLARLVRAISARPSE
jgi:UDP-GlcNAc:undecaprenyl-phosphate/decaprenyl-phosphate GlcNAc-1-phosphate transferase